MKNKGKKLLAMIVAILFMLGSATGAYAYWAANFAGDDEVATATAEVGEGETVTTTVTANTGSALTANTGSNPAWLNNPYLNGAHFNFFFEKK